MYVCVYVFYILYAYVRIFSVDCVHSVYHSLNKYSMYSLAIVVHFPFFTEGKSEKKFPAKKMAPKDENVCGDHLLHTHPMLLFVLCLYSTCIQYCSQHIVALCSPFQYNLLCVCISVLTVECVIHCVVFQNGLVHQGHVKGHIEGHVLVHFK